MPITLKPPAKDTGYASPDSGLGELFASCVSAARSIHFNQSKPLIISRKKGRKDEISKVNSMFNEAREYIAQNILLHLLKNDGVVDAWPNPDTGLAINYTLSDDEDNVRPGSYDTYYYEFDYFGTDFSVNDYGGISGGKRAYRNPYEYKDTQRLISIRNFERDCLDEFKENNPFLFLWALLIRTLLLFCVAGPALSTLYLFFLQRAADPETVELALEAFFQPFNPLVAKVFDAPTIVQVLVVALVGIPAVIIAVLKFLPECICSLGGTSTMALVIYGLIMFVVGFMALGFIYAFVQEKIPSANPIKGFSALRTYFQSKSSQEHKDAEEENERLRAEYTKLMEDFHSQWYNFVSRH